VLYDFATERLDREERSEAFLEEPFMQKKSPFTATGYGKSWGGCEELWSRTAMDLAKEGFAVSASIVAWFPPHERVLDLTDRGLTYGFALGSH
jgi:hypothetical protein